MRVDVEIENPASPGDRRTFRNVLVYTGAELSWFPAETLDTLGVEKVKLWHFRQANGTELSRWTGGVSIYVAGLWTIDEVVFGEPNDLTLLGARSLEGLNVRIDPVREDSGGCGTGAGGSRRWLGKAAATFTTGSSYDASLPDVDELGIQQQVKRI